MLKSQAKKICYHVNYLWDFVNKHAVISGIIATVVGSLIVVYLTTNRDEVVLDETEYYDTGEVPADRTIDATEEYSKLRKLAPGLQISTFQELLGKEQFVNDLSYGVIEYVFVNPLYYVEAAADENNNVLFYSLTTRKPGFNPKFDFFEREPESNKTITITLGKSTFSDLDDAFGGEPIYATYSTGANRFYYYEAYYPGRPYQTHIFSMNQSGYHTQWPVFEPLNGTVDNTEYADEKIENKDWLDYRKVAVINTYTITAPFYGIEDILDNLNKDYFGPNLIQVRLVD